MKKILSIISSINGEASFSTKLSNALLEKLLKTYPHSQVTKHDLSKTPFPYQQTLHGALFTPVENHSADQKEAIKHSDNAIKELKDADVIIIGVPMYNFGIPAALKAWIDNIVRPNETFRYAEGGPIGLLTNNKKVYLAIASGGIYSDGFMKSYDFTEPYLRAALGFLGLTDLTTFRIEGTGVPEFTDAAVSKAFASVNEFTF